MKVLTKMDKLLADLPARRRVILLEEALKRARQDAKGQEKIWRECAAEDVDTNVEV
jgi:hypothetical protein